MVAARHAVAPGDLARGLELMTIQQQREQQKQQKQQQQHAGLNALGALGHAEDDSDELDDSAQSDNYQQKIAPLQDVLAAANEETRARDLIVASIRTRKRHDLIVCASLVDRVPNLAGVRFVCFRSPFAVAFMLNSSVLIFSSASFSGSLTSYCCSPSLNSFNPLRLL